MSIDSNINILIYQTEEGNTKIDVRLENGTVWMTQKAIAELYQKGVNTINEHIKNIFEEGELEDEATIRKNRIVQTEGKREVEREVAFYNLEMILLLATVSVLTVVLNSVNGQQRDSMNIL